MAYRTIPTEELIQKFKQALNDNWGYIWGTAGIEWTEAKQKTVKNEMAQKYGAKWIGHRVADCSGLFSWAFKDLCSYTPHGSNSIWDRYCVNKGQLINGHRSDGFELKPGTAVFKCEDGTNRSHIGLYIGNNTVIEAASTQQGVITTKITNKKWSEWGELKYVDYGEKQTMKDRRTVRYNCKGEDVKELQVMLNAAGYSCGEPDGIFGNRTFSAVKNFQASRGLVADGIVGPKTWAALESIGGNQRLYKVTITGISQEEATKLRGMYPGKTTAEPI